MVRNTHIRTRRVSAARRVRMGCVSGLRSESAVSPQTRRKPRNTATSTSTLATTPSDGTRTLTGKRPSLGIPPPRLIMPGMDSRGMRARMGEGFLARLRLVRKESASRGSVGTPGTGALEAAAAAHRAECHQDQRNKQVTK